MRTLDLDGQRWAASNEEVVREYWAHVAPKFTPSLEPSLMAQAIKNAQGNVLHAVKLAEWLLEQPAEERRAAMLPSGLDAFLEDAWQRIQDQPMEVRGIVLEGLELVAVAREALPLSVLADVAEWKGISAREQFLRVARPFLLEESGHWGGEKAWRLFHKAFHDFILSKLGEQGELQQHRRLAENICKWSVDAPISGFRRNYTLRHGVTHWLKAQEWQHVRKLCMDLSFLEAKCQEIGIFAVEEDMPQAVDGVGELYKTALRDLHQAVRAESHWLREDAAAFPRLIYNRLLSQGWKAARIAEMLHFPGGLPALRLRHPVRLRHGEVRTLKGHDGPVNGCTVTPSGWVVSASDDKTLRVWELETGKELARMEGHEGWVRSCAVIPDGRVVSASDDKTLRVWELETGKELARMEGHKGPVWGCSVTPDGRLVSASFDEMLRVWELKTGIKLAQLVGHKGAVNGCAVTVDGRVVSASSDGTLRVWELETGKELARMEGHEGPVNGCAVTVDGRVVSASSDGTLRVWELETGKELARMEGHEEPVNGCAVAADGWVLSASNDKTLRVWELDTGREVAQLEGHEGPVKSCAVTEDGWVVSASDDKTLRVWELETARQSARRQDHKGPVWGCTATSDGRLVSASSDKTLKVWELKTKKELARLEGHDGWVRGCAVTANGRLVSASSDRTLRVWNLEAGKELMRLEGHAGPVNDCAVTARGQVVSASSDRTLRVWDLETGKELMRLEGHDGPVWDCAVTARGQVVSASSDRTLRVWDLETGKELVRLEGHDGPVLGCVMTADGRLVSASSDKTLRIWEPTTGKELARLEGHRGPVWDCAMTADGMVISASDDKTLGVWDIASGQRIHTFHGMSGFRSVAVTRDTVCAGDTLGNIWMTEIEPARVNQERSPKEKLESGTTVSVKIPAPVLEAYRSNKLALFVGSGLSLGKDVQGDFPTWGKLPERLLDACKRYDSLDEETIRLKHALFRNRMRLESMLSELGTLRTSLGRDYQNALNHIFRPPDAAPGKAQHAVIQLGVRAILTTNYDQLLELTPEMPRRQPYTWKDSDKALADLRAGRKILLKVHGTSEHHDTVVMSEVEYREAHSNSGYQAVLRHLLQEHLFLFVGYGMNDPLDLDLALKSNVESFGITTQRHYVLLRDAAANDHDRIEREYNIRIIDCSRHEQVPEFLESLAAAKAIP
ncbi:MULTISPECIES: SIR2 family protein [Myxococcus]|nr:MULTISPECIES: SIR2 family protein [Myxococcus]UYI11560.1 SIR2 family protein [Myxococcus xanthus]UYI18929.1 SIR2 family protein [Myxococcus xanthus]